MNIRIGYQSQAWYDLINAAQLADDHGKDISISIEDVRGEIMTAVKVGEAVWSAHQTVTH